MDKCTGRGKAESNSVTLGVGYGNEKFSDERLALTLQPSSSCVLQWLLRSLLSSFGGDDVVVTAAKKNKPLTAATEREEMGGSLILSWPCLVKNIEAAVLVLRFDAIVAIPFGDREFVVQDEKVPVAVQKDAEGLLRTKRVDTVFMMTAN